MLTFYCILGVQWIKVKSNWLCEPLPSAGKYRNHRSFMNRCYQITYYNLAFCPQYWKNIGYLPTLLLKISSNKWNCKHSLDQLIYCFQAYLLYVGLIPLLYVVILQSDLKVRATKIRPKTLRFPWKWPFPNLQFNVASQWQDKQDVSQFEMWWFVLIW